MYERILCILTVCLGLFSILALKSYEDEFSMSLRTLILVIMCFVTGIPVILGIIYFPIHQENVQLKAKAKVIEEVNEKSSSYSIYVDGIEVSIENINVDFYAPNVVIDDEHQKILIGTDH